MCRRIVPEGVGGIRLNTKTSLIYYVSYARISCVQLISNQKPHSAIHAHVRALFIMRHVQALSSCQVAVKIDGFHSQHHINIVWREGLTYRSHT